VLKFESVTEAEAFSRKSELLFEDKAVSALLMTAIKAELGRRINSKKKKKILIQERETTRYNVLEFYVFFCTVGTRYLLDFKILCFVIRLINLY
jgi:hypothetical protein